MILSASPLISGPPGRFGFAQVGPAVPHHPGLARLGQRNAKSAARSAAENASAAKKATAWYPYATPADLDSAGAIGTTYTGSLAPFYAGVHAYHWDPTLQYQAPRPSTGNLLNPSSHAWFDKTLTYQAERGGLYGATPLGAENAATSMSPWVKAAIGLGAGMVLIGAGLFILR